MRFEFATAGRIVFGVGTVREAGGLAAELGSRALLVTGRAGDVMPAPLATTAGGGPFDLLRKPVVVPPRFVATPLRSASSKL